MLAIVALAVLSGIDAASSSTAREKARAVAGALAEQDQERLRSYRFDALATVPQADPGERRRRHIHDRVRGDAGSPTTRTRTPACGNASQKQAEYLRITRR